MSPLLAVVFAPLNLLHLTMTFFKTVSLFYPILVGLFYNESMHTSYQIVDMNPLSTESNILSICGEQIVWSLSFPDPKCRSSDPDIRAIIRDIVRARTRRTCQEIP